MHIGLHSTWDVYDCDRDKLSYVPYISEVLHAIVDDLGLGKVKDAFKQFEPVGVTGFILLEESHISIHTWPEHGYAAVDVFSCKPFDVVAVENKLKQLLGAENVVTRNLERGEVPNPISS